MGRKREMVVDGVVDPEDVYVPAFADDVAVVACGTNLEDLRESIQWALDKIQAPVQMYFNLLIPANK